MTDPMQSANPASWGRASGPRAGFWRRFAADFLDGVIIFVVELVFDLIFRHNAGRFIGVVVSAAYFTSLEGGRRGATLGKQALGIRVIDANTGEPIGYPRAFVRWITAILSTLVLFLGYLWMLWDREKQCWHDKFAGDVVVPTADYPVMSPAG